MKISIEVSDKVYEKLSKIKDKEGFTTVEKCVEYLIKKRWNLERGKQ